MHYNSLISTYLNILSQEKQSPKQDYINNWPYMIQFHNFNNSSSQLNIVKDTVKILESLSEQYKIDKKSIVHEEHGNTTYMIEWDAKQYTHPNNVWNKIYEHLLKNHTQNKYIFWKSLLPNQKAQYGFFRPGTDIEEKLGDKFKETRIKAYFKQYTQLKLEFYGINDLPVADGHDIYQILEKFIDIKLNKIDDLKIVQRKINKSHNKTAVYYVKYKLTDETEFQDKLKDVMGINWHPTGDGYSFHWSAS